MAQWTDPVFNPAVDDGPDASNYLNNARAHLISGGIGPTKPSTAVKGFIGSIENGVNDIDLVMFDGSDVVVVGTVDASENKFVIPYANIAAALVGYAVPPGALICHAANTAPTGFLKANGAAVSRTTYAALFAEIGTTYGIGNGSTTFNLPDLRGDFPRGWDDGRGVDAGRVFGSRQEGTWIRTVAHEWAGTDTTGVDAAIGTPYAGADAILSSGGAGGSVPAGAVTASGSAFNSALTDNIIKGTTDLRVPSELVNQWIRMRPTNSAFLFCIKY